MKKNSFLEYNVLIISILLLFTSCKSNKEKQKTVDAAFAEYVSAFSSGVLSNKAEISIRFAQAVEGKEANMNETEKLFHFSPSIKGKAYWRNNQILVFQPDDLLPSDQNFDVELKLAKLIKVPKKLKTLAFSFVTKKQRFNVEIKGFHAYENEDLTQQKLSGTVHTSDYVKNENLEKTLIAKQDNKNLTISWEHLEDGVTHNFIIEQIERKKEKGKINLSWNGKEIHSEIKGEKTVEIPPLGYFDVFDVKLTHEPKQCIVVYFTDPINTKKDLNGLIYLENDLPIKIMTKGNEVKIYPEKPIKKPIKLIIEKGIENIMNYPLNDKFVQIVEFSSIKPNVEFIGDGVILPNSEGLVFPFKAVNLKAVNLKIVKIFENNITQFFQSNQYDGNSELRRVGRLMLKKTIDLESDKAINFGKWNNFSLDLSELIKTEPGAIYRIYLSFDRSQSLYPCENSQEEESLLVPFEQDNEEEKYNSPYSDYYYDSDEDYYYNDNYIWEEREDPCKDSYYMDKAISRNILASNLGIIVKSSVANELKVAITNLTNAQTMSDVKLEVYNYQNQLIGQGYTNQQGIASIALPYKGFLLVAKKDNQRGYLRIDDGSALSLSMFNVAGAEVKKGLKGYLFAERGVWRPGDSIYLQFILQDKNKTLPTNHPVVIEIYTPENQLYSKKTKTQSLNGFYDFRTATQANDPTGNWLVKATIGGSVFTKYLKIESIKPNRLKIKLDFDNTPLKKGNNFAKMQVEWLHGAKAKNLKADVEVAIKKIKTSFKSYKDYIFDDPSKQFYAESKKVFEGTTDYEGKVNFNLKFKVKDNAPGMLNAKFKTRVFEKSGNFSSDIYNLNYSPYESYVGVKIPEGKGYNKALYSNETTLIPIVCLSEDGKRLDRKGIKVEVIELDWEWWWEQSDEIDLGRYTTNESRKNIFTKYIDTKNGEAMFEFNLNKESWGRKLIRITDPISQHSTGKVFYTTYKGWWEKNENKNSEGAEMLVFNTDKEKYKVGETVNVSVPETKEGRILVSLETGSKILETFWVEANAKQFTFKVSEEMTPNVYIYLTFIQPHQHKDNDLPIRMYGVQNILVENPETHLHPEIIMSDELEPEKEVTIKIKEAKGKKMTYSIAMVDEGLLDLTRFTTPNAWKVFFRREALGIKTWDLYKYVIGAYSGKIAGLLAVGGDAEVSVQGEKKANRFKPVVKFLGPFELKANGSQTHKVMMPNYIGAVRTMVVAAQNGAYGAEEKRSLVKKPLMVMATLPRVISPNETVSLPVTIFAMDKKIDNVSVSVKTNEMLENTDETRQNITFNEIGEKTIDFKLKAVEKIGLATVKVIAKSGKYESVYDIELDVRMPNPPTNQIISEIIEPGKTWKTTYKAIGIKGTNSGVFELSSVPSINLESRLQFLMQYPHGCIEQITSGVFPQLYLSNFITIDTEQSKQIEENIKAGISKLARFQKHNGGFTYWAGESAGANEWGSNYAGHFLLEAKNLGYSVPERILNKWIKFQKQRANNWSANNRYASSQIVQAYRLYTLALAKKPVLGAMNRMRELPQLSDNAKWRLAAAYSLAGRKKAAEELIKTASTKTRNYTEFSGTYGNTLRDKAMLLEALTLFKKMDLAKRMADDIAKKLSSDTWLSTQTSAYCLLSMAKFVNLMGKDDEMKATFVFNKDKPIKINTKNVFAQQKLAIENFPQGNIELKNNSKKTLFAKLHLSGVPLPDKEKDKSNELIMSVQYTDMNNKYINVERLEQGTDFIAEVKITHPAILNNYQEMALSQLFPSGWEIRNLRFEENTTIDVGDIPRYQDIRDDRIYTYFDLKRGQTLTFKVLLNASYVGKFYLPAIYCEAMYDNEINAQKGGKWVEVIKAE